MEKSKIPFKTNVNQSLVQDKAGRRRKTKLSESYLASEPKPLKVKKVNIAKEKTHRIIWLLKWILLLPLSVYVLTWSLLLLVDLFNT